MKRIILTAAGAAIAGLTACSPAAAPTATHAAAPTAASTATHAAAPTAASTATHAPAPTAAAASHRSTRVPVGCSQRYNTWTRGQGKGLIAALDAVSSAETVGDTKVLTVTLKKNRSAISRAAHHPVPACADPRGYWDALLMHVTAAAANVGSASSMRAAMRGVPKINHELNAELKAL